MTARSDAPLAFARAQAAERRLTKVSAATARGDGSQAGAMSARGALARASSTQTMGNDILSGSHDSHAKHENSAKQSTKHLRTKHKAPSDGPMCAVVII